MADAKTIIKNWCAAAGMPEPSDGECHALEVALSQPSGNAGELDESEAAERAVLDHLGPAALTGGKMSVYEAFHLGWKVRAAQSCRIPAEVRRDVTMLAGYAEGSKSAEIVNAVRRIIDWLNADHIAAQASGKLSGNPEKSDEHAAREALARACGVTTASFAGTLPGAVLWRTALDAIIDALRADRAARAACDAIAYRVLRRKHDGEWVSDGRGWCDGLPSIELQNDIADRSDGWRVEYAYPYAPKVSKSSAQGDLYATVNAVILDLLDAETAEQVLSAIDARAARKAKGEA